MPRDNESPQGGLPIPMRVNLELELQARIVTYEISGKELPGGMCGCCGGGPDAKPDWRSEPWYVYRAGICDADGVYYSMLCEGCLEEIREENARRPQTERDEIAREVTELLARIIHEPETGCYFSEQMLRRKNSVF